MDEKMTQTIDFEETQNAANTAKSVAAYSDSIIHHASIVSEPENQKFLL